MANAPQFHKGDVVRVEGPPNWFGFAIVRSHRTRSAEVNINWIVCANPDYYWNHEDGSDAFVPPGWCTKIEVGDG